MTKGFILSNKYRKMIFDAFATGEADIYHIAKKHHIVSSVAFRIAQEFVNEGIAEKVGNQYRLTPEGDKLAVSLK